MVQYKKRLKIICFATLAIAKFGNAQRVDQAFNTLDPITVISRNLKLKDSASPFSLTVLDSKKLKSVDHRSTPESLMGSGGLFIQKTNHGGGSTFIRGLTGNQILLLVDGIRLNNSTYRYGPNQYLNSIDLFNVSKIEVAKGVGSVEYGSDALGGVINMVTIGKNFTDLKKINASNINKFISSNMEQTNRSDLSFTCKSLTIDGGISFKKFGDLLGGGNIGKQVPSGYTEFDYDVKVKIKTSTNSMVTLFSQESKQYNIPFYHKIVLENYKTNQIDLQSHRLNYIKYKVLYKKPWVKEINISASQQYSIEQRSNQKTSISNYRKEADTVQTIGITSEIVSNISSKWIMNTGFDYYQDKINSLYTDINPLDNNNIIYKRGLYPNNALYKNISMFNLHHLNVHKVELLAGIRLNKTMVQFKDITIGHVQLSTKAIVGNIGLSYSFNRNHLIYSNFSNGFRAPNIDDMGSLGIVDFRYELPSDHLKAEKSFNSELGYRFHHSKTKLSLAGYYMSLNDIITRVKVQGVMIEGYNVYNKLNIESAYIKGLEFTLVHSINNYLQFTNNLTYTYGQNLTKSEPLRRIPPLFGQNGIEWQNKTLSISIIHQFAGAQTRLAQADKDDIRIGQLGTSSWNTINLLTSYQYRNAKIQLGLINMFNEKYKTHGSGIYGMGRSIHTSICINL